MTFTPSETIRTIAIVEDDSALRDSFLQMISTQPRWKVTGSYARGATAIPEISATPPDIVLMDIQLPGRSGIELVRLLKPLCPQTQFLMVTVYDNSDQVYEALVSGASGYLLKRDAPFRLLEALDDILEGGSPMSSAIARKVVLHFQQPVADAEPEYNLSAREKETLDLLAKGYLYKEIADQLGIKLETVRYHLGNIYRKLHVRTRTEAVIKFLGGRQS
ncbi:MAG: response regulator transcription factor [Verrucomicrobiota bacterium]